MPKTPIWFLTPFLCEETDDSPRPVVRMMTTRLSALGDLSGRSPERRNEIPKLHRLHRPNPFWAASFCSLAMWPKRRRKKQPGACLTPFRSSEYRHAYAIDAAEVNVSGGRLATSIAARVNMAPVWRLLFGLRYIRESFALKVEAWI